MSSRRVGGFWRVSYALLLGQLVSFASALVNFTSSLSANLGVNAPFTLATFSYLSTTLVFGSIFLYRRQKLQGTSNNSVCVCRSESVQNEVLMMLILQICWYWYVLLAFIDVQATYLFIKAFQFSSITSVTILSCWTLVWVIILTRFFLDTKYSVWQFLGAALCVTGLCLVLFSDSGVGGGDGSNPVVGDVLVIAATCCVAFTSVGEEFCVKKVGWIELLTMLGLFGLLTNVVEMAIFERKNLESVSWSPQVILTFAGHGIAAFMSRSLAPLVLQASGAMLFNLSLLTADMWAVLIRVFLYHQKVDWLYYVSFLLVGIGVVIYSKTEKHSNELPKLENGDTDQPYEVLPEEAVRV